MLIRRYGIVEVGLTFLEDCSTVWVGFEVFLAQVSLSVTWRPLPVACKV